MEERLRLCVRKLRTYGCSYIRRRVYFNLMLGNAFFLGFCLLFNIADVRNLLVRLFLLFSSGSAHIHTGPRPGDSVVNYGFVGPCVVACVFLLHFLVTELPGKLKKDDTCSVNSNNSPVNCSTSTANSGNSTVNPSIEPNDMNTDCQCLTSDMTSSSREMMTTQELLLTRLQFDSMKCADIQTSAVIDVTDLTSRHTEHADVIPDMEAAKVTPGADVITENDYFHKVEDIDSEQNCTEFGITTSKSCDAASKSFDAASKICETGEKLFNATKICKSGPQVCDTREQQLDAVCPCDDEKTAININEPHEEDETLVNIVSHIEVPDEKCEILVNKPSLTAPHKQDDTLMNNISHTLQNKQDETLMNNLSYTAPHEQDGTLVNNFSHAAQHEHNGTLMNNLSQTSPLGDKLKLMKSVLLAAPTVDCSIQTDFEEQFAPPPATATSHVSTMTDGMEAPPPATTRHCATMTERPDCAEAASRAALALYRHSSAMTSGPFMKKLRRARRVLKEAKVKVARDRVSTLTPWRVRLERYRDRIEHLTQEIATKDQLIGVTSASRRQQEDEIKSLTSTLRNSQDKLETQQKLNLALATGIQERGGVAQ